MIVHDTSAASSNRGWFAMLSLVLIGGILATPTLTVGTFAQLDNTTDPFVSNGTMSSDTTGTAAIDQTQTEGNLTNSTNDDENGGAG